jgi:hypothetical protein
MQKRPKNNLIRNKDEKIALVLRVASDLFEPCNTCAHPGPIWLVHDQPHYFDQAGETKLRL